MRRLAPIPALAALLTFIGLLAAPAASAATPSLSFLPCPRTQEFSCATLPVPLDRTGVLPGNISLSVERKLAGSEPTSTAVLALAGGPGQATLPLGEYIAQAMTPALGSRDLLLFDQRGTGASDPLACSALEEAGTGSPAEIFQRCALDIGPARGDFTTQESVQDIEALRAAAGYEKLVLYGTSYGTKVALEYAERYPQHVGALLLDSTVPPEGPEPFELPSYQAIGPVLSEICSAGACNGITANPLADLAKLTARIAKRPLSGSVYDGLGKRHAATLTEPALFDILLGGDLNPALRALLPAAVVSALHNDPDPLLRLARLAEGLIPTVPSNSTPPESSGGIDEALFATTSCEELPFPWQRGAAASQRTSEALAALNALPANSFSPFDPATALVTSLLPDCVDWPDASPPPPALEPLPDVPTLILSGMQDMRTPTPDALRVASRIPGAQVLTVPFTGHSVLGSDLSGCASKGVAAFFAGAPVQPCTTAHNEFAPTPVTPTKLAYIHTLPGLGGRAGQTLVAVLDTLVDLNRQVIGATLEADAELPAGSTFGGLRGGYARLSPKTAVLHRFSFVPGVELSATFAVHDGTLQPATISVSGREASAGSVRVSSSFKLATGTLGGRRFSVTVAGARLSRAGAGEAQWPTQAGILRLLHRREDAAAPAPGFASRLP
jgi:pimeloyl-ACP methyl ester carboxylesterase